MKRVVLLLLICLSGADLLAQSPGGISSSLRWWLKANAEVFKDNGTTPAADNDLVAQWNDKSPSNNTAVQATDANKPVYKTNVINGNPVLRYATDQFVDATNPDPTSPMGVAFNDNFHMFMVFKQNSYTPGGTTDGSGTFIIDRTTATNNLLSFKMANTDKYYYQKRDNDGNGLGGPVTVTSAQTGTFVIASMFRTINVAYGIYLNGKIDVTASGDSAPIPAPQLRVGRHATTSGGGLNGDLAELILYNSAPTNTDRQKILSYLAIKYGITLDQSTAYDYLNSGGAVIYPATTSHDNYDVNIAGIGRDDNSGLLQTASQSQNVQNIVRMFNPSSLSDGDFLVWGNDAPVIWNSNDVPSPYVNRISRLWRAAVTGDADGVGDVDISFDLSGLGIDMSDPTKFALLTRSNSVLDGATAYTTGRTISGNVVTFTGATIHNNDFFSLACPLIPGPGGVAATTVWLRADENTFTDNGSTPANTTGQLVQQWGPVGGVFATQGSNGNKPAITTNAFNSNPVLSFDASRFMDFSSSLGIANTADLQMSLVFRPNSIITSGTTANNSGSYFVDRTTNTTPIFSLKAAGSKAGLQEQGDAGGGSDGPSTSTSLSTTAPQIVDFYRDYSVKFGTFYNGAPQGSLADAAGPLTFPVPRIGAAQTGSSGLDGDIAEFIFYNRDITTLERNRIDSYLAIKYGITLDQVTATNYTASDGSVIYPAASTHISYNADITGIGKDAVSRLTQSSSKSVNNSAVVQVTAANTLSDLSFFIFGDNNGTLLTSTATGVDGTIIKRRLSRVWRVAETGANVGPCTFAFDLSAVPGPKLETDLRLMVDGNNNGFADNDITPLTGTLAGNVFTVTGVDMANNWYFTIGTTNASTTPLPIQLTDFNVAIARNGIQANWRTQSEINNDYFTLLRSFDGEKFEETLQVPGAGTSKEIHFYEALDKPGAAGDIYYQLKQTDFDGKTSYSEIRKVTLKSVPFNLLIYPNPIDGSEFTTEVPIENNFVAMEVFNSAGQVVFSGTAQGPVNKWNIGDLPKGIYFVKVISDTGADVQKLVLR